MKHTRHEVRYWPLFRKPEANERAFPKGFLIGCFISLFLWFAIAKFWDEIVKLLQ